MMRTRCWRWVMMADQWRSVILPTMSQRASPRVRAGITTCSGSSHKAWASSKSMPCLSRLAELLAGSYSNSIDRHGIENLP